jgi:hypothetical protein
LTQERKRKKEEKKLALEVVSAPQGKKRRITLSGVATDTGLGLEGHGKKASEGRGVE